MQPYTPEQRQQYADMVCELAREWIVRREADFEIDLERGAEWRHNTTTGGQTPRANPTVTLTLRVNGGSPPLFRGPPE
jgi:hypothetical protein